MWPSVALLCGVLLGHQAAQAQAPSSESVAAVHVAIAAQTLPAAAPRRGDCAEPQPCVLACLLRETRLLCMRSVPAG